MKLLNKWNSLSPVASIAIGLPIGVVLGIFVPEETLVGDLVKLLGILFTSSLKAIAPVLVFFLVISAVSHAKASSNLKAVILLYLISTFTAACVAAVGCHLFPIDLVLASSAENDYQAPTRIGEVLTALATELVYNPISSLSSGNYLGILLWSILLGFALHKAPESTKQPIRDFARALAMVVRWIICFAPLGVMGIAYSSTVGSGPQIFIDYGMLILLLVGCMLFVAFVTNPLIVLVCTRKNPYPLVFRCLKDSAVTAFFTSSSATNLPVNLSLCEELGLDPVKYSVSVTLGAAVNKAGAAVTITVMALQAAYTLGVAVDLPAMILLCIFATIGAAGTSGVPGGSLLLIPMACGLFSIEAATAEMVVGIGAIIGVVQDACETALNSSSDVLLTASAEYREWKKAGREFKMGADNITLEEYAQSKRRTHPASRQCAEGKPAICPTGGQHAENTAAGYPASDHQEGE